MLTAIGQGIALAKSLTNDQIRRLSAHLRRYIAARPPPVVLDGALPGVQARAPVPLIRGISGAAAAKSFSTSRSRAVPSDTTTKQLLAPLPTLRPTGPATPPAHEPGNRPVGHLELATVDCQTLPVRNPRKRDPYPTSEIGARSVSVGASA
jgi:hypothetical protein